MEVLRRYPLVQLLLFNSFIIGRCSSCGVVNEELIEYRRQQLQRRLLDQNGRGLDETAGTLNQISEAPDQTTEGPLAALLDELQEQTPTATEEPTSTSPEEPYNPKLLFHGSLLNELREPLENAQIQFWQADLNGNYLHPGDDLNGFDLMTDTFSYFGTASTDSNGTFDFITYRPGIYLQRPVTHIHFKVFVNGTEYLTSQFYFADEGVGRWYEDSVVLTLTEDVDEEGNVVTSTEKEIVVNTRTAPSGSYWGTTFTPRDMEGPFYPLLDFFDIGADMTSHLLVKYQAQALNTTIETLSPTDAPTVMPSEVPTAMPTEKNNNKDDDKDKDEDKDKDKDKDNDKNKDKDKNNDKNKDKDKLDIQEDLFEDWIDSLKANATADDHNFGNSTDFVVSDGGGNYTLVSNSSIETLPENGDSLLGWPSTAVFNKNQPRLPEDLSSENEEDGDRKLFLRRNGK